MTDRHYEPYRAIDPASDDAAQRRAGAASLPAPYPGDGAWVRSVPLPIGAAYLGPRGRRDRGAWLVCLVLASAGSALYLAYAAMVAPAILGRPVTEVSDDASAGESSALPPTHRLVVTTAAVIPPPQPAVATVAPRPAASVAAPTPIAAPRPARPHRLAKPVRLHEVAVRSVPRLARDTRHPLSWYAR